ncbi:MAG: hypothetical protein QNK11_08220 [Legionella sp.]|nr:hypothetical protein [Legionella sp.]
MGFTAKMAREVRKKYTFKESVFNPGNEGALLSLKKRLKILDDTINTGETKNQEIKTGLAFVSLQIELLERISSQNTECVPFYRSIPIDVSLKLRACKTPEMQLRKLITDPDSSQRFTKIVTRYMGEHYHACLLKYYSDLQEQLKEPNADETKTDADSLEPGLESGLESGLELGSESGSKSGSANFTLQCLSAIMAAGGAVLCAIAAVYMSPVLAAVGGVMLVGGLVGLGYSFFSGGSSPDTETKQTKYSDNIT